MGLLNTFLNAFLLKAASQVGFKHSFKSNITLTKKLSIQPASTRRHTGADLTLFVKYGRNSQNFTM